MPPEPKPGTPPPLRALVKMTRDRYVDGIPVEDIMFWLQTSVAADAARGFEAKPWALTAKRARKVVELAQTDTGADDRMTKDQKRGRNRAMMLDLYKRLVGQNTTQSLVGAIRAVEQLCKIDGSYDPTLAAAGAMVAPSTDEEAQRLIDHASATLELARRRGLLLAAKPEPRDVIDVEGGEVIDVDDEEELELVEERRGGGN